MLNILENKTDRTSEEIAAELELHLAPWEEEHPTREQVAGACRDTWPAASVFVGGHHVAVHFNGENRDLLITADAPDFK